MLKSVHTIDNIPHDEAVNMLNSLSHQNDELRREFEEFVYIISHDFQAPLRGVVNFSELLRARYDGHFDEKGNKHFSYVINGSRDMQEMLGGLMHYSRTITQPKFFEVISLSEIMDEAKHNLNDEILSSNAVINIKDSLPDIYCDATQMILLLTALIDNAIKFQPKDKRPEISIEVEDQGQDYLISISDNGIGIAQNKFEEIFKVFRRLNKACEYSGIGMGLVIAKKIIENHGGDIWVKSELGEGSAVYITMPKP